MKWLLLLGSVISPFIFDNKAIRNPIDDFKGMVVENAAKVVFLLATVISLAIVLAAGIITVALNIGTQIDQTGSVTLSSVLITGLILIGISVCVWAAVLSSVQVKKKFVKTAPLKEVREGHALQDSIALLIADFVKSKEDKRIAENHHLRNSNKDYSDQYRH